MSVRIILKKGIMNGSHIQSKCKGQEISIVAMLSLDARQHTH
jgi:hypothetical protein